MSSLSSIKSLSSLGLSQALISNLDAMGYQQLTDIQAQTLPHALKGRDVLAQAKTGSGKTASFALPLIEKLQPKRFFVQGLILCPTRELASQVADECRKLARYRDNIKITVLSGGVSIGPQIGSLKHGAHIVVGTPGRICDHLRKGTLNIDRVSTLILDEADRMLEMGFAADIDSIIGQLPSKRQTLLFSATYPKAVNAICNQYLQDPSIVRLVEQKTSITIDQQFLDVDHDQRPDAIAHLLGELQVPQAVIFCNTKQSVHTMTATLKRYGISALGLHGDLQQKDRDRTLIRFKQASIQVLIATDVAARGLDVDGLPLVINAELPRDTAVYIHRIGRTGRAGKDGLAVSYCSKKEDHKVAAIADAIGQSMDQLNRHTVRVSDQLPEPLPPTEWVTLAIAGGRKDKLRPGDVLGAITKGQKITGDQVGNITILDFVSYVAVRRSSANTVLQHLQKTPIKGRQLKSRRA